MSIFAQPEPIPLGEYEVVLARDTRVSRSYRLQLQQRLGQSL
jgi:hypothetical protein